MKRELLALYLLLCLVCSCDNKPIATLYSEDGWGVYTYKKGIWFQREYDEGFQIIPQTDRISVYELGIGEAGDLVKNTVSIPVSDLFIVDNTGNIPNPDIMAKKSYGPGFDIVGIELYSKTRWPGKVLLYINETKEYYLFPVGGMRNDPEGTYYVPFITPINNPYLDDYFYPSIRHFIDEDLDQTYYAQVVYNTTSKEFDLNGKTYIRLLYLMEEIPGDVNGKETAKLIYKKFEPSIKATEKTQKANDIYELYGYPRYETIISDYKKNSIKADNTYLGRYYLFVLEACGISRNDDMKGKYSINVEDKYVGAFYSNNDIFANFDYPVKILLLSTFTSIYYSWPYTSMQIDGINADFLGVITGEVSGKYVVKSPDGSTFYINRR